MKILEKGTNFTVIKLSEEVTVLFSYTTPVAAHVSGRGYIRTDRHYSRTTSTHIGKWLDGAKAQTFPHEEFEKLVGEGGAHPDRG